MEGTLMAKRGRPKGSKNKKYEEAKSVSIPAVCPKCKSTALKRMPGRGVRKAYKGILDSGHEYSHMILARHRCDDCGQYVMVKEYVGVQKVFTQPRVDEGKEASRLG